MKRFHISNKNYRISLHFFIHIKKIIYINTIEINHIIEDNNVTKIIFFFIFAFIGAEVGVPYDRLPSSCCVLIFKGNIINKIRNQNTAKRTKDAVIVIPW